MSPLAYGYMCASGVDGTTVRELEAEIERYAEKQGFRFVTCFHEYRSGSFEAWDDLIALLRQTKGRHLIVPSLDHLAHHELLCEYLLDRLGQGVEVHELHHRRPIGPSA